MSLYTVKETQVLLRYVEADSPESAIGIAKIVGYRAAGIVDPRIESEWSVETDEEADEIGRTLEIKEAQCEALAKRVSDAQRIWTDAAKLVEPIARAAAIAAGEVSGDVHRCILCGNYS